MRSSLCFNLDELWAQGLNNRARKVIKWGRLASGQFRPRIRVVKTKDKLFSAFKSKCQHLILFSIVEDIIAVCIQEKMQ